MPATRNAAMRSSLRQMATSHPPWQDSALAAHAYDDDDDESSTTDCSGHDEQPVRRASQAAHALAPPRESAPSASKATKTKTKAPRRRRERRPNRAPGQPPRPPNSYILFRSARIAEIRAQHGDSPYGAQSDLSKQIAEEWHTLSLDKKSEYEDMAEEARRLHYVKYPGYRFQPRRGLKAQKKAAAAAAAKEPKEGPSTSKKKATPSAKPRDASSHIALTHRATASQMPVDDEESPVAGSSSGSSARMHGTISPSTRHDDFPGDMAPSGHDHVTSAAMPCLSFQASPAMITSPIPMGAEGQFVVDSSDSEALQVNPAFAFPPVPFQHCDNGAGLQFSAQMPNIPGLAVDPALAQGATELGAMEWSPNYRFPALPGTSESAGPDLTPHLTATDSSRPSTQGDNASTFVGPPMHQLLPVGADALRRPSCIHALPVALPDGTGQAPEIAQHYDIMEPVELWMQRRKSHSLAALAPWYGATAYQPPTGEAALHADFMGGLDEAKRRFSRMDGFNRQSVDATEWQKYLNVPDDEQQHPLPDGTGPRFSLAKGTLMAGLDLGWPTTNSTALEERAQAFSDGVERTEPKVPGWTRDEVIDGRAAWFSRGSIATVSLPSYTLFPQNIGHDMADIPPVQAAAAPSPEIIRPTPRNLTALPRPT